MADVGIGKPRRHRACGAETHDLGGEARNLLIGFERSGGDARSAMASLAMLLKNRQNIAIKSWMNGERLRAGSVLLGPEAYAEDQQDARRE